MLSSARTGPRPLGPMSRTARSETPYRIAGRTPTPHDTVPLEEPMSVALVSGASRGLGAVIARRLAADGFAVAVNYAAGRSRAEQVVADIRSAGGTAEAFGADVTDEAAVQDLAERVRTALGPVKVLVANATGPQPATPVARLDWSDHLAQLELVVKSPSPLPRSGLAARGGDGITVNLVAPGWVPVERHGALTDEDLAGYLSEVPMGRIGKPADVAAAVSYLASEAAGFVTGQRLTVNGGHNMD